MTNSFDWFCPPVIIKSEHLGLSPMLYFTSKYSKSVKIVHHIVGDAGSESPV